MGLPPLAAKIWIIELTAYRTKAQGEFEGRSPSACSTACMHTIELRKSESDSVFCPFQKKNEQADIRIEQILIDVVTCNLKSKLCLLRSRQLKCICLAPVSQTASPVKPAVCCATVAGLAFVRNLTAKSDY